MIYEITTFLPWGVIFSSNQNLASCKCTFNLGPSILQHTTHYTCSSAHVGSLLNSNTHSHTACHSERSTNQKYFMINLTEMKWETTFQYIMKKEGNNQTINFFCWLRKKIGMKLRRLSIKKRKLQVNLEGELFISIFNLGT